MDHDQFETATTRLTERDLRRAMEALQGIATGEVDAAIIDGSVAGLDTALVVLQTPGGMVPVFAYVNRNLAPLLRNGQGEAPYPLDGGPPLMAS